MAGLMLWIRELFLIMISITFLEILLPDGKLQKYVKFIFSIFILAVMIEPIGEYI